MKKEYSIACVAIILLTLAGIAFYTRQNTHISAITQSVNDQAQEKRVTWECQRASYDAGTDTYIPEGATFVEEKDNTGVYFNKKENKKWEITCTQI